MKLRCRRCTKEFEPTVRCCPDCGLTLEPAGPIPGPHGAPPMQRSPQPPAPHGASPDDVATMEEPHHRDSTAGNDDESRSPDAEEVIVVPGPHGAPPSKGVLKTKKNVLETKKKKRD